MLDVGGDDDRMGRPGAGERTLDGGPLGRRVVDRAVRHACRTQPATEGRGDVAGRPTPAVLLALPEHDTAGRAGCDLARQGVGVGLRAVAWLRVHGGEPTA